MTFASASLPALPAFAEPTASDLETARELYKEGRALRDKNDLKAALEKFKGAHALASTPVTGLELGRTHMLLTELVEAREAFLSVAKIPFADKESVTSPTPARRQRSSPTSSSRAFRR